VLLMASFWPAHLTAQVQISVTPDAASLKVEKGLNGLKATFTVSSGTTQSTTVSPTQARGTLLGVAVTETQRTQIQALAARTATARHAILARYRSGQRLAPADEKRLRSIGKEHNASVLALFTSGQRTQAEAYLAARHAALVAGHRRAAAARRVAPGTSQPRRKP